MKTTHFTQNSTKTNLPLKEGPAPARLTLSLPFLAGSCPGHKMASPCNGGCWREGSGSAGAPSDTGSQALLPCGPAGQGSLWRFPAWGCSRKPTGPPSTRARLGQVVIYHVFLLPESERQPARWKLLCPRPWDWEERG